MLNFQKGPKPKNYLARREQWPFVLWIVVLGVPLVAGIVWARTGMSGWLWLAGGSTPEVVDTRLAADAPAVNVSDALRFPPPGGPLPETGTEGKPGSSTIDFSGVRDDDLFRAAEADAWFSLFEILQDTDPATLRRSSGRVTFIQLFRQSDEYRGKLVSLQGTLRRARLLGAAKNEVGIREYYQVWLQPADNPRFPIVIYCLDLPPGFPTGAELEEEVEITGFFFKRWAYLAKDTVRTAPVVLARDVCWHPRPKTATVWEPSGRDMLLLILGAAVFAAAVTWLIYDRTRRMGSRRAHPGVDPPSTPDPGEALQRLVQEHSNGG